MTPLGLYVHWPFCARICPYCDFTVAKVRPVDEEAWADALAEDLDRLARLTKPRPLRSVYFGGGTPSLIPPRVAARVFEKADALFGIEAEAELTVEANPDDLSRFETLAGLGFERLSLGVQSLRDEALRFLGRNHGGAEARVALEGALNIFSSVSTDLIYARPGHTCADWEAELAEVIGHGLDHLSLYQLTIEPQTPFGLAAKRGTLIPSLDDLQADLYELTQEVTEAAGLHAYEVSNHARSGFEAVHNNLYWSAAEWLAIGPGAHGRLDSERGRIATEGAAQPKTYPALPASQRLTAIPLSPHDVLIETLSGGMRPVGGLDTERLGGAAEAVRGAAGPLIESGHLVERGTNLAATKKGRLVLDYITARLADALPCSPV